MTLELSRRALLRYGSTAAAGSVIGALGFGEAEQALAAAAGAFRLEGLTETRNTCPYCSVSCGVIMYGKADGDKPGLVHIEGDADHPVNRGTLCPKGAALLDFVHAETRTTQPLHRAPGADKFEPVTWDFALDRIAKLMKEDRDANFVAKNQDGVTVNR